MKKVSLKVIIKIILFNLIILHSHAQQMTQTIRGKLVDTDSKFPIVGATVIVLGTEPLIGASTDAEGNFELKNVPIGRIDLKVSSIGYKDIFPSNLTVISGKELSINLEMEESLMQMDEIVIKANQDKTEVNNDMAIVGIRSFDVEETSRFAGSRNDPARMAANFAGVSGANDSRNDIIIRGNSPSGVLWRLEGIDIPSPNHFSSFGSTGGPVSMLNNNLLAKSDFMTAAFPAQYGNALAGVFDLQMRKGNSSKHEFLGQVGFNGFEAGAEGPFSKNSNASYLVNYRYSTLGVFDALGIDFGTGSAIPQYQDLSFKLDFPTKKAGRFTIFGLGGTSSIDLLGSEADLENDTDLYGNENEDIRNANRTGIIGLSHTYFFNETLFSKLTVAATYQQGKVRIDSLDNNRIPINQNNINNEQSKIALNFLLNKKFNARNSLTSGIIAEFFNARFTDSLLVGSGWHKRADFDGNSFLAQAYSQWQHKFSDKLVLNTGLHFQYFDLNQSTSLEPRLGLRYNLAKNQSLSLGYGLHSQIQPILSYFQETQQENGSPLLTNKNLDFTRSHHFALAYDYSISSALRLKAEIYYQNIQDAAVESVPSSFSMLNAGADFGLPDNTNLVNNGIGRNYGMELTLEKFFSKGYYFLVTGSFFQSEYQGSDEKWRNTAFNGNYVVNLLAGKEFNLSTNKKHQLAFDWKLTAAGGRYYTPVDLQASENAGYAIYQEDKAYSERFKDYFRTDLKISYRMNSKKVTHEFSVDMQNISNQQNEFLKTYNRRTNDLNTEYQLGLFIVPQYRILF